MPNWTSIATGFGGLIIGALLQYLRDGKILARSEAFTCSLVKHQEQRERSIAEWQQQYQQAIASIGSVRRPGGGDIPPFPSLPEFELPSSRRRSVNRWLFKPFRKTGND